MAMMVLVSSAIARNDAKAVALLDKAVELHGGAAIDKINTLEWVTSSQNIRDEFSTYVTRLDIPAKREFTQQSVLNSASRGVVFQRVLDDKKGKFWAYNEAWSGSNKIQDMPADWAEGSTLDKIRTILLLRFRKDLSDLKLEAPKKLLGKSYQVVSYKYGKFAGVAYFDQKNYYVGQQRESGGMGQTPNKIDTICTGNKTFSGFVIPVKCTDYDEDVEAIGFSKLASIKINPKFSASDFALKVAKVDKRTGANPFGMVFAPSNTQEIQGLRVVPAPLVNPALSAGLDYGDEIISVNGKKIITGDFVTLEAMFWDVKLKKVVLVVKKKSGKTATYTVARK